ncbi:MAG: class I SAM-dependent methyltransferase [Phycisphaerales bacterium]|nr:class I SAM-dependent methyltransferase [Phycisphaerales bacterium]
MADEFFNTYEDQARAESYAGLEFPGTYSLAFRDLPALFAMHVAGRMALDFGCGSGRSTRFLKGLGFESVGIDISAEMLSRARARDPEGEYLLVGDGDFGALKNREFDLVFCAFPFDNVPTMERKVRLLRGLAGVLRANGRIVNLVSSPEIYVHEWASFSTKDFPENRSAKSGDIVRVVMLDVEDRRPVEDVLWTEESYRETYARAGLEVIEVCRPLGEEGDGRAWVSETTVAPWTAWVLGVRG